MKVTYHTIDGSEEIEIKLNYYYKHIETSELVLVFWCVRCFTIYGNNWDILVKDPVSDRITSRDLRDFILDYQEYNP